MALAYSELHGYCMILFYLRKRSGLDLEHVNNDVEFRLFRERPRIKIMLSVEERFQGSSLI